MAKVHSITVDNLISRVREVFPDAPENYIMMLINDALVELGLYNIKNMKAKLNSVADQMWYDIGDNGKDKDNFYLKLNKLFRVDFMDSDGDYIQIPRLLDTNILLSDITSESAIDFPSSGDTTGTGTA